MKGGPACPKRGTGQRNCDEVLMNLANLQKSLIKHLMSHHFFSLENTTTAKDLMFPLIHSFILYRYYSVLPYLQK